MLPDHETCYRAITAKDPRFDGRLFTGVITTGIYCRPICPARVPKSANVNFYISAAAAHEAGFRPCLRCRPETAPDTPAWRGTSATIGRALRLIEDGGLDENSVAHLAMRLGIGERQLRRLFQKHVGASPIAVAQTRRILLAKQLLHETRLPMVQVGLAAGFGSIRRFNEVFQTLFGRPPTQIRRGLVQEVAYESGGEIALKLRFRPPYDWRGVLQFLTHRLYQGVETINNGEYARTFTIDGIEGIVRVREGGHDWLNIALSCEDLACLPKLIAKVRAAFDLGSDPHAIQAHLSTDHTLRPLVEANPGLRLPRSWDGFEGVVRAVLGQQITVKAAIELGNKLVKALGPKLLLDGQVGGQLTQLFPTAMQIATADLSFMPMPKSRQRTLALVAVAFVDKPDFLNGPPEDVYARLSAIAGIGPWTREYIALRVMGDPDAMPSSDVALVRAMANLTGQDCNVASLANDAILWQPWRSYGAQHLWASLNSS